METKRPWRSIFRRTNQDSKSHVANVAPVDEKEYGGPPVRMGERTRRARRKVAPSLFDRCEVVSILSFEVGCAGCGLRARYEIRPAAVGPGRMLVRVEVLDGRTTHEVAAWGAPHPDFCTALYLDGMDFRALAQIAGKAYLVARARKPISGGGNQPVDRTGNLFDNGPAVKFDTDTPGGPESD